jgi:hypothetical protein
VRQWRRVAAFSYKDVVPVQRARTQPHVDPSVPRTRITNVLDPKVACGPELAEHNGVDASLLWSDYSTT